MLKSMYKNYKSFNFSSGTGLLITTQTGSGSKVYMFVKQNQLHREDGPAHISEDQVGWFLYDKPVTEEEVLQYAIKNENKQAVKNILWKKYLDEEWDFKI